MRESGIAFFTGFVPSGECVVAGRGGYMTVADCWTAFTMKTASTFCDINSIFFIAGNGCVISGGKVAVGFRGIGKGYRKFHIVKRAGRREKCGKKQNRHQ